jgi:hypothetical protein
LARRYNIQTGGDEFFRNDTGNVGAEFGMSQNVRPAMRELRAMASGWRAATTVAERKATGDER